MKAIIYSLVLSGFLFVSCGGDDDANTAANCATSWTVEYSDVIADLEAATTVWATDPSQSNCDVLKDAYQDYINALEDWEDCANQVNVYAAWEAALDAAQLSLNTIC